MEIIKSNSAFLCNYEVMQILQQLKDNTQKKHKREGSLATVTYETVHYLQNTDCKNLSPEKIEGFLEAMKCFKLTKSEKLMMVNTPPRTELEIQLGTPSSTREPYAGCRETLRQAFSRRCPREAVDVLLASLSDSTIVQESEERLSEEDVAKIIEIVNKFLPAST